MKRLVSQLEQLKLCRPKPKVSLCLASGKIANVTDRVGLKNHFEKCGWKLFDDNWIAQHLKEASESDYENDISLVVTKLLLR